ncbi:hypothetical protein LTR94_011695 [Friedmanniomyces endolithicus]|nr:hypothetical protein LTR94_011695 [Friedmanniomyces endolithicus]
MPFSSQATSDLKTAFEDACKDGEKGLPGVVGVVIGKDGTELFAQASEPMSLDSIFWIASCTKMITGVACMQLVEQGKLSLDDPAQVELLCPELKDVKVSSRRRVASV